MKISRDMELHRKQFRGYDWAGDHTCGTFYVENRGLVIIASIGEGWDHVSVSKRDRCPTWEEMQWVRERFFGEDETVMQIHPPLKDHISVHPYCLHLWRPQNHEIPLPPKFMIA